MPSWKDSYQDPGKKPAAPAKPAPEKETPPPPPVAPAKAEDLAALQGRVDDQDKRLAALEAKHAPQ